jgi:hypothetical protein
VLSASAVKDEQNLQRRDAEFAEIAQRVELGHYTFGVTFER